MYANENKKFNCKVESGDPKPSDIIWTINGQEIQEITNAGAQGIELRIKQEWNGKKLKCSVTQTDTKVRWL